MRIRRVPCSDELLSGGEARRSDWLLENAAARYFIRDTPDALTRLSAAGGTIVDASGSGADDVLTEAVPLLDGEWFVTASAAAVAEDGAVRLDITGTLPDGREATVTYRLTTDEPQLDISGADGLSLVPTPGTEVLGPALDDGDDLLAVLGADTVDDAGGWVHIEGTTGLLAGDREITYETLYADGRRLLREASGEWVELYDTDLARVARLPIESGQAIGAVPGDVAWARAVAEGAAPAELSPIDDSAPLEAGPVGALLLRATDGEGGPVAVTVSWQGLTAVAIPAADIELPLAAGSGTVTYYAGPGRELLEEPLEIIEEGVAYSNIAMPWAVTPGVLVDVALVSAPDPSERRTSSALLTEAAGRGVRYAVKLATDEVAGGRTSELEPVLFARNGSRSAGTGSPSAWPWSTDVDQPAHGAIEWAGRSAEDLLAVMSRRDSRTLMVTPEWLEAAGPPAEWLPAPDLLQIEGLGDLEAVAAAFDAWLPLSLVGPLTWVDGVDPREPFSEIDVEAGLLGGRTTATSGPRLHLTVSGATIGEAIDAQPPLRVSVRVEAPSWIPLSDAVLLGPGATVLAAWSLDDDTGDVVRLEEELELTVPVAWLSLAAWGEEAAPPWLVEPAWALTSPVWLDRP